jgi:Toastrack DUF4097
MAGRAKVVVALGAGLLLLGACGWEMSRNTFTDDATVDAPITKIRVENDSGDVKVRTGDATRIHRTVHYDRDRPGATQRVEGDTLVIDSCPVRNCWIDYEVTVPANTRLDGTVHSGRIEADGVNGVNLEADSGDVRISQVKGRVNVVSHSGTVHLSDIGDAVVVRSDSGDVSVDNPKAGVTVQADSGAIRLTVPRGAYRVNANTDSGEVRSGVTDEPSATTQLELHTDSGDIDVSYAA